MLKALFGLALVLRLLIDMATPLMPGAFRFNPSESVEAHRAHSVRSIEHPVVRPISIPPTAVAPVAIPRPDVAARTRVETGSPRFRPLLARQALEPVPESVEDH
ncbi:MAG: hypothetical protein HYU41_11835 [Candidatus Rokubacteria bacterium]|nr:hypothetical protein [Candidatus Rokubacteria bacterium]